MDLLQESIQKRNADDESYNRLPHRCASKLAGVDFAALGRSHGLKSAMQFGNITNNWHWRSR